ncbi:MAG TPA: energy transducer TonB, partial [Candidatus Acidoferrum sp.]
RVTARALGRIMKLNKANLAGLTSPEQQSEMKSILAGTWPPLKPLPVFKYETTEYRATISFDRKRGEWVCRKTSLPSNEVQELRGGLREITMALPHGKAEVITEGPEAEEQEFEKDAHRRLQAIRAWREKYKSGTLYFELRDFLSEGQRIELDDSLRLSLTARQLQFNPKNVADVFEDLSVAGGRFAALIEFAKQNKAKPGTDSGARQEGTSEAEPVPEAGYAAERDGQSLEIGSPDFAGALHNHAPVVPHEVTAERSTGADEFPALSIKNVFPEPDQAALAEPMAHTPFQRFAIEDSDIADADQDLDSPSLVEHSHEAEGPSPAFTGFAAQVCPPQPSAGHTGASSWHFPRLEISAFHVNVFALMLLFAATSFTVGLTVGRGPLGKRLREPPPSLLAKDAKPPTLPGVAEPDAADELTPLTPTVGSSDDSAGAKPLADAIPYEERPTESPRISDSAEAGTPDADSSPAIEAKPTPKPEANPAPSGAIGPVVGNSSKHVRRPKAVRSLRNASKNPARYKPTSATVASPHPMGVAPHVPRSSTILVTVPDRGSQAFRVSFPDKTIAATSSLAMTSQLSVLVPPEAGATWTRKSARLEAGELVSFGWPRYPSSGRSGLAETIRVRATIGQLGQVQEVQFLGGSASLLLATREAIRQWRYTPTLLDKRALQAQQDITIEFRPPQYLSQLATRQHPSHN